MSELTKKLINLRESKDWTKTFVARKLKLKNMQTYANWEYGKSEPDSEMLKQIANLYGISVDSLLDYKKEKKNTVDLDDENAILTFEGKPVPPEDLALMRRLLRGKPDDK